MVAAAISAFALMFCSSPPPHAGSQQGEGDGFVVAFSWASDAVACALPPQRAPLAPIRLRIGMHTGEIQLRDDADYLGPTINRNARLRDLAHGGLTVLSGAIEEESPTGCQPMPGWSISAPISCAICPARNALCSCAIPTFTTSSPASHTQRRCVAESSVSAHQLCRTRGADQWRVADRAVDRRCDRDPRGTTPSV
jgi:hypothetical protein